MSSHHTPRDDHHAPPLILVVDDDPGYSALVQRWLQRSNFRVETHSDAESLLDALSRTLPDAVCLDLGLPGMGGMEVLPLIRQRHRTVPIIILTGDTTVDSVVQAIQNGAYDYVPKTADRHKLITTIRNAVDSFHQSARLSELRREAEGGGMNGIVGRSPAMRAVFRQLERVSASDIQVLVHGETGSGKELVARAIHDNSARASGPFIAVNCAAIPETLQDSEFFGHERGAFTGANKSKAGRFEQADGGTLFLDEVGELSPSLQAKLLRVLQERRFERVGGVQPIKSDFRLITATHRDLARMVECGEFREDLYFRVAVFELELPPLRQREGDLALLTQTLLERIAAAADQPIKRISPAAAQVMARYPWPGNVRELQNVLQRASVVCDSAEIAPDDLPARVCRVAMPRDDFAEGTRPGITTEARADDRDSPTEALPALLPNEDPTVPDLASGSMTLDEIERWAIERTLDSAGGNVSEAIRRLGIGRTTLYRKLKQYGLR